MIGFLEQPDRLKQLVLEGAAVLAGLA